MKKQTKAVKAMRSVELSKPALTDEGLFAIAEALHHVASAMEHRTKVMAPDDESTGEPAEEAPVIDETTPAA